MATVLGDLTRKYIDRSVPQGTDLLSIIAQIQFVSNIVNTALGRPLIAVLGDISRKVTDYTQLTASDYLIIIAKMQELTDAIKVIKNTQSTIVLGLLVRNCQNNIKPTLTDFLSIISAVQVLIDAVVTITNPNTSLGVNTGAFSLDGKDTILKISGKISIPAGTFILSGKGNNMNYSITASPYIIIPDAPTFINANTLTESQLSTLGELFYFDTGAVSAVIGKDTILAGNWNNGIEFNGINGSKTNRWRFKNLNNSFVVTAAAPTDVHRQINNCNFIEIYGNIGTTIPANYSPYRVTGGQSGLNFPNATGLGTTFKFCNMLMYNHAYAGMLLNLGGGSNVDGHGWNGLLYNKILTRFCRVDGISSEGEGFYHGHTSTPYAVITDSISLHDIVRNKGREGQQDEHCTRVIWYNMTFRSVGTVVGQPEQTNLLQQHDNGFGIIENCIFDGAPNLWNIFLNSNYTFRNCYFRWTNGAPGFIGNTAGVYFAGSPRVTGGGTGTFVNCQFLAENGGATVNFLTQFADPAWSSTFTNCKFSSNIANIFQDIRGGGATGVLTGNVTTNGNTQIAYATMVAQKPTYLSNDFNSADYCKVTTTAFLTAGMGAMTKVLGDQDLVEVDEIADIVVANGTAFGANGVGVGLPQSSNFMAQDGLYRSVPITWSAGSYNGSVQGDYVISGSPTISAGIRNASGLVITTNVHVNATSANTLTVVKGTVALSGKVANLNYSAGAKHIIVNLGGLSMSYLTGVNYNHIPQNYASGVQIVKGENSGDTLASLRKTDGVLTGYQVNIIHVLQGEQLGQNTAGVFPASFNVDEWTNPSAGSRSFEITGLDNSKTYTIKIMCSVDIGNPGNMNEDVTIAGATGGGTFTIDQSTNVTNFVGGVNGVDFTPTSGKVTITLTKTNTRACISGFDLFANGI